MLLSDAPPPNFSAQPQSPTAPKNRIESLNRKHAEYTAGCDRWQKLKLVVAGGCKLTDEAKKSLLANPDNRPSEVVKERVKVASYVNKIAPILTRFNAQLFEEEPNYDGSSDSFWSDEFLKNGARLQGDDDNRASFFSFLRQAMFEALTCGKAIAQVDTAIASGAESLNSQKQTGEDKPYVVLLSRCDLWDWKSGENGFDFVKLHKFRVVQDTWDAAPIGEHDFTIYYRKDGRVFASRYTVRKITKPGEKTNAAPFKLDNLKEGVDAIVEAIVEDQEIFNIAGSFKFPVLTLTLPDTLWLADQLLDAQVAHYNTTAGIQWKLQAINFAMPVLSGGNTDDEDPLQGKKFGDGFYLRLPEGYSLSSMEIGGSSISTAIEWRKEIDSDIRAILYQLALSAADGAAIKAQSAASKREDTRIERQMLEVYGQIIREFAKQILDVAAIAHNESVEWKVDGFTDFLGAGLMEAVEDMVGLGQLPIPSTRFKREVAKTAAREFARSYDLEEPIVNEIEKELESAEAEKFDPPQPETPLPE